MICRIILKVQGKTTDLHKQAIRSLGGYWDDLFDAWSLPIESAQDVAKLMNGIECQIKQFNLPESHVNQSSKERTLYGKYGMLTKQLIKDETQLIKEITIYEKENPKKPMSWNHQMYEEAPIEEGKPYAAYLIEKNFHVRMLQLRAMRQEIRQIHLELLAYEEKKKGQL